MEISAVDAFRLGLGFQRAESGCLEWQRAKANGYGVFKIAGHQYRVTTLMYWLFKGELPPGLWVLHTCDNRACGEPEHLYAGNAQQNSDDKVSRERQARGHRDFNADDVRKVREMLGRGESPRTVAAAVGMSISNVRHIKSGRCWAWLPNAVDRAH